MIKYFLKNKKQNKTKQNRLNVTNKLTTYSTKFSILHDLVFSHVVFILFYYFKSSVLR
jgi:hypothetical protein